MARVLVACEFSGVVRDAFRELGHDAWSCDLLDGDGNTVYHYKGDIKDMLTDQWDLMVAHPPCTYLTGSGEQWFTRYPKKPKPDVLYGAERQAARVEALEFVQMLLDAPIKHIALENPIGKVSTAIRKPDQIIQPWQYGHGEVKATCLWLKNLPKLVPTDIVEGREARVWYMSPGPDRWKERSRFLPGIAKAMAEQWGKVL